MVCFSAKTAISLPLSVVERNVLESNLTRFLDAAMAVMLGPLARVPNALREDALDRRLTSPQTAWSLHVLRLLRDVGLPLRECGAWPETRGSLNFGAMGKTARNVAQGITLLTEMPILSGICNALRMV